MRREVLPRQRNDVPERKQPQVEAADFPTRVVPRMIPLGDRRTGKVARLVARASRSFFVYGWAPAELVIDASAYCDRTERIERIET